MELEPPRPLVRFEFVELLGADDPSFDLRGRFGGHVVAHARASMLDDTLFVEHLDVDESHRARGIGTAMLREMDRLASTRGLRALRCCLWRGRDAAELGHVSAWLSRHGFDVALGEGRVVHCVANVSR